MPSKVAARHRRHVLLERELRAVLPGRTASDMSNMCANTCADMRSDVCMGVRLLVEAHQACV